MPRSGSAALPPQFDPPLCGMLMEARGFDAYGLSPEWVRRQLIPAVLLYRYWFRCEAFGSERLPAGRVVFLPPVTGHDARNESGRAVKVWTLNLKRCD